MESEFVQRLFQPRFSGILKFAISRLQIVRLKAVRLESVRLETHMKSCIWFVVRICIYLVGLALIVFLIRSENLFLKLLGIA